MFTRFAKNFRPVDKGVLQVLKNPALVKKGQLSAKGPLFLPECPLL